MDESHSSLAGSTKFEFDLVSSSWNMELKSLDSSLFCESRDFSQLNTGMGSKSSKDILPFVAAWLLVLPFLLSEKDMGAGMSS